jgi:hypothetical protein
LIAVIIVTDEAPARNGFRCLSDLVVGMIPVLSAPMRFYAATAMICHDYNAAMAMMHVETIKMMCYNEQVGFPAGFAAESAIGFAKGSTIYGSVHEMP